MVVTLLLSPAAAIARVADDGGFVEARVKMQIQLVFLLAQVNGDAVGGVNRRTAWGGGGGALVDPKLE